MRKHVCVAFLIGIFAAPAFALESGPYYVGLDMTTHTCSVMTEMKPGMKNMGQFKTKDEAEKAMAGMSECKGG
jgi:hypothetical protein